MHARSRTHAPSPSLGSRLSRLARATAIVSLLGCAAVACDASDGDRAGVGRGALALTVTTSPSVRITTVLYAITGNGLSRSGSIDVSSSNRITGYIGGIPAGAGYQLTLTATTLGDLVASCSGSASFDITAGGTSAVNVALRCNLPPRTGSIVVHGTVNLCPQVEALSALPAELLVGGAATLTAQAIDFDAAPGPLALTWSASGGALVVGGASNASVTCTAPGPITVTVTASDGDCSGALSATVTCLPGTVVPPAINLVINEVESNQGVPGDWVELYNPGPGAVDLSNWLFRDNEDGRAYTIPAGTVVPAGGYFVLEEAAFGFGLGANDSARLFRPDGSLYEGYTWTGHAATTYGRCPNGTGPFVVQASVTKGAANACGTGGAGGSGGTAGSGSGGTAGSGGAGGAGGTGTAGSGGAGGIATAPWPGSTTVTVVASMGQFGPNLSGLTYQPASGGVGPILWAAQNGPPTLHALQWNGSIYAPYAAGGFATGKALRYASGTGNPDTEGVTKAAWELPFVYTATERNNDASTTSRNAILRYDTSAGGSELIATHEWLLNPDLPTVGANLGIEAITWVPDGYLVSAGFIDETTNLPYNPAAYPAHGDGVFIVGVEANGMLYAYVLDHGSGAFTRVATLSSGFPAVMGLEYDRELNVLWAWCDNTCGNRGSVFAIDTVTGSPTRGRFTLRRVLDRPADLPNTNNEGIAFAPLSECVAGLRAFLWSDDDQSGGFALRQGSVTCALPF